MKRLHVHVGVDNLDASIAFYSTLFGTEPSVTKDDYAKWMLDDPRVNFAISAGNHARTGVEHLGIQAENADELAAIYGQLEKAGRPVLEEGETTCCYARSEKSWVSDPDGVVWETFLTHGEATHYGSGPSAAQVAALDDAGAKPGTAGCGCCA
ncbi:MAG: ArsI/CadI family heavy metal resistance metalloenzyme [Parasphingopyxis sp.]|uniref:ArsI/CadI family heavy metal resistance metalloenzyme n=1 Tax=Parasphingopyxis sp. TaxID=1920299 RepID=UPI003FA1234F